VYLQRIQDSVTTWVIFYFVRRKRSILSKAPGQPRGHAD
jgi:hypothetical protein